MKTIKKSNSQITPQFARFWHLLAINEFATNPFIARLILNTVEQQVKKDSAF